MNEGVLIRIEREPERRLMFWIGLPIFFAAGVWGVLITVGMVFHSGWRPIVVLLGILLLFYSFTQYFLVLVYIELMRPGRIEVTRRTIRYFIGRLLHEEVPLDEGTEVVVGMFHEPELADDQRLISYLFRNDKKSIGLHIDDGWPKDQLVRMWEPMNDLVLTNGMRKGKGFDEFSSVYRRLGKADLLSPPSASE